MRGLIESSFIGYQFQDEKVGFGGEKGFQGTREGFRLFRDKVDHIIILRVGTYRSPLSLFS